MEDYEVKPNRKSFHKLMALAVILLIWGYIHLPMIDVLVGYDSELVVNYDIDKATSIVKKRALIQAYSLTIPLLMIFTYVFF